MTDDRKQDQPMESLVQASRVHRGYVMDDTSRQLNNADVGRILKVVREFLDRENDKPRRDRFGVSKIAKKIAESKSTVSQVINSNYPKGKEDGYRKRDEVLRKLDRFMAEQRQRMDMPVLSGFAWTTIAEEIKAIAHTTVMLGTIGAVWSPAGCGKTLTAKALLAEFPGSMLITADESCRTPGAFLDALVDAMHLRPERYNRSRFKTIAQTLRESKRLVMIDEAHLASLDVLNTARQIHDATDAPMLLLGLPALAQKLMAGRGDDSKGATLYSRVRPVRDLTERCRSGNGRGEPLFSVADVKKIFARSAVRIASEGVQWLQALACLPEAGGLRACDGAAQLAAHMAKQKGETLISKALLVQAAQLLLGVEGARRMVNQLKQLSSKVA